MISCQVKSSVDGSDGGRQNLVEMGEDDGPCLLVAEAGFVVGEAGVGEAEKRARALWRKFNGDNGFRAARSRRARDPGHFDEAIGFEAEEAAIVGVALVFKMRLEKENGVHLRFHNYGSGSGKPAVKLFGPGEVEGGGRGKHGALAGQVEGMGGKVWWG